MQGHKFPHSRYARRIEHNGTWTVFDTFTGQPANVSSRLTMDMQMSDRKLTKLASEMAAACYFFASDNVDIIREWGKHRLQPLHSM